MHGEADLRDATRAHVAGHLDPLEDAGRRGRRSDRARLADVVRAVRRRAAMEPVALDRALEPLADRGPGDLDLVARLEDLDRDVLTLDRVGEMAAELDEMTVCVVDPVLRGMVATVRWCVSTVSRADLSIVWRHSPSA